MRNNPRDKHVLLVTQTEATVTIVTPNVDEPEKVGKNVSRTSDSHRYLPVLVQCNGMLVPASNLNDLLVFKTSDEDYTRAISNSIVMEEKNDTLG